MKRFKIPAFWQAVLVVVIAYLIFDNAFPPVTPLTLLIQYMVITIISVLLYFSFDDERWAEFKAPVAAVVRDDETRLVRWGFLIAIPAIIGYTVYGMVKPSFDAPVELRQVHPAPPHRGIPGEGNGGLDVRFRPDHGKHNPGRARVQYLAHESPMGEGHAHERREPHRVRGFHEMPRELRTDTAVLRIDHDEIEAPMGQHTNRARGTELHEKRAPGGAVFLQTIS